MCWTLTSRWWERLGCEGEVLLVTQGRCERAHFRHRRTHRQFRKNLSACNTPWLHHLAPSAKRAYRQLRPSEIQRCAWRSERERERRAESTFCLWRRTPPTTTPGLARQAKHGCCRATPRTPSLHTHRPPSPRGRCSRCVISGSYAESRTHTVPSPSPRPLTLDRYK